MATPHPSVHRPAWLVLGAEPVAALLPGLLPEVEIRFVDAATLPRQLAVARPRLVIVSMPPAGRDHLAAVALERRRPRTTMRAVLLTEPDDLAARLAALEQGFDDALPITMDARELVARLRRLVAPGRPGAARAAIPIADDVELDLQAYELRRAGRPQQLRPKELQLLSLLATHPRRAFTRAELIERVWGPAFAGDHRTIDVHLRWLRSKVEADPEHPVNLVTVRGRGYRFDPPR